jgi:hypothetical protein
LPPSLRVEAGHGGRCRRDRPTCAIRSRSHTQHEPGELDIFLDETGYAGQDILNLDQPVYALASTNLSDDRARELIDRCFRAIRPLS